MPPEINPGFVFKPNAKGAHTYVVISTPSTRSGHVLVVNWTTLRESSPDDVCILQPGEHPSINRTSTIAYSRAQLWITEKIAFAIEQGALLQLPSLKKEVLERILRGARESRELRNEWKALLPP